MKKIFSSALLVVMALVLALSAASCAGSGNNDTSSSLKTIEIPGGYTNVGEEVLEALQNSGTVGTYFLTERTEYSDWEKGFVETFETVYGGSIDPQFLVWEGWQNTFMTQFASNSAPDLLYLFEKLWPKGATRNFVYTVKQLKEKGVVGLDHPTIAAGYEEVKNFFTTSGETYVFAKNECEPAMIFVNEDIFTKAGVTSPSTLFNQGKWNYDTFLECAEKTTLDTDGSGSFDQWGYCAVDAHYFVVANGGQIISFDDGVVKLQFTEQKTITGLEQIREVFGSQWGLGYEGKEFFQLGKIAMFARLPRNVKKGQQTDLSEVTFKWSMVPFPLGKDNTNYQRPGNVYAWAVSSASNNPQGAVNYIIARNDYIEKNPDPNAYGWDTVFDETQIQMIQEYAQNVVLPIYIGVGTLETQYSFWDNLKKGSDDVSTVIESFTGMYQGQVDIENQGAEAEE